MKPVLTGGFIIAILAIGVATGAPIDSYYEAKVASFGCTSIAAVTELEHVRVDVNRFQAALVQKQIYGECVAILKGTLVKGSVEGDHDSILRVNREIDPPGYEAPLGDFQTKETIGEKGG